MAKETIPMHCPNTSNLEPVNPLSINPRVFRCPITGEKGYKKSIICPGDVDTINKCNKLQVSFSSTACRAYGTGEQPGHVGGDNATLFEDIRFD